MFIIIRNELVYYLSPVLTPSPPPIYPPDHPAAPSRDYLQTNYLLKPTKRPSTFDIVSPTPRGKRNNCPPLLFPRLTLFTFCSLSSEKQKKENLNKQQTHDISFSSMSAVPAATQQGPFAQTQPLPPSAICHTQLCLF